VPLTRLSLADQVADAVVEGIATGQILPGARLVEDEIAESLAVSRVPVREAFKVLATQGILVGLQNRGVVVADFDAARISQVRELRTEIEKVIAREASEVLRSSPDLIADLDSVIEEMRLHAARGDWIAVNKTDLSFHRTLCRIAGNAVASALWDTLARHTRIIFGRETGTSAGLDAVVREHVDLKLALLTDTPARLARRVVQHINRASFD
jgi:DNA-binding GntR family transcriptional regulator